MPKRTDNRDEREISAAQLEPQGPVTKSTTSSAETGSGRAAVPSGSPRSRKKAAPKAPDGEPDVTGIVGDASATGTRSGEDTRRRGWFWHWNNIVTQYAPMIGLKGVGLINSYTVWTDRRESSPHRGYAFPSQQSEADFYGEDRAELITINKILVTLDLIEIRKEMMPRTDEKGRRWKVPHNFYRVKDHGDGFTLTARDVMKVAELADRDRAVYRYLRRMFSPKFSPIDTQNVWHAILEEVRETEVWQRLAAKTAKEESKASARSRAGHAARRTNDATAVFSLPEASDSEESESTVADSRNDSTTGAIRQSNWQRQTSVAHTNNGLETSDEQSNTGLAENAEPTVAPTNRAPETIVEPTNSMYYQSLTTTTTHDAQGFLVSGLSGTEGGPGRIPDNGRDESHGIRLFEEANNRVSTPAERRLLRQLAERFHQVAANSGSSGWDWLGYAIDDAVAAGSAFVAPKRLREILTRWERDGLPGEYAPHTAASDTSSQVTNRPVTSDRVVSHRPTAQEREVPVVEAKDEEPFVVPVFTVDTCGMTNRQIWSAVLGDLQFSGAIGRADISTWLRDAAVIALGDDGELVIGVPHELARRRASGRYLGAIRQAVERVTGIAFGIEVVLIRDWAA